MNKEIDNFIHYLQFEKRFSPHTVTAYKTDLRQFASFLKRTYSSPDICRANHDMVRSWLAELMNEKILPRSVNRKITSLKTFYHFLLREKKTDHNPVYKVQALKVPKRLPLFIAKQAMDELLEKTDFGDNFEGKQNRLILELFYGTGMRLSELINIMPADIDLQRMTVKVLGKRNKERIIPLHYTLKDSIRAFMKCREGEGLNGTFYFFTHNRKKLYPKFVYRLVKAYLGQVTTLNKKSPHVLRHTFATHMLEEGADLNAIKELLGHSSLAATQVYTHNTIEKLKNIYQKTHPKA